MRDEEWSQHPKFPSYMFSTAGRVYSILSEREISPGKGSSGYWLVNIKDATGKFTTKNLHRLIAEVFIDNPDSLPTVDHIDRNVDNNAVDNLRWATRSGQALNTSHKSRYKPVACFALDGTMVRAFESNTAAALWLTSTKLGASVNAAMAAVSMACKGRRESAYGMLWKFV